MFKRFRQYNQFLRYIENDLSPYCAINGMDTREIIVALIELGAYVFNGGPVPEYLDDTWRIERDERRDAERWHWELEQHKLSQTSNSSTLANEVNSYADTGRRAKSTL